MLQAGVVSLCTLPDVAYHQPRCAPHLKLAPSVRRALPPVGVHITELQLVQSTTDCEWLKTVVIWKQPAHFTSMK